MEVNEFQVVVPWGHIAIKAWGKKDNEPILMFHGLLDNAGSFDRLIPYLPDTFYYLVVDLPGHGKSSHFPPFLPITAHQYLFAYRALMKHFGKKSYKIISHSLGGQIALEYAQIYPMDVDRLVIIDAIHTHYFPYKLFRDKLSVEIDYSFELFERSMQDTQPKYTYEEALDRAINNRHYGLLTKEAAIPILDRGLEPVGDSKYRFVADPRLKRLWVYPLEFDGAASILKANPIMCPTLFILADDSRLLKKYFHSLIEEMKKIRSIKFVHVAGNHDVHNTHPERIKDHIIKFLLDKPKL